MFIFAIAASYLTVVRGVTLICLERKHVKVVRVLKYLPPWAYCKAPALR